MAQIVLKILANEDIGETITGLTADKSVNNVSSLLTTTTTENDGVEGMPFGSGISISSGYVGYGKGLMSEVDKYNGYMFGLTNGSGEYTLTLSLTGTLLDKILIVGDKTANQFPTQAVLDEGTAQEKTIYSDDVNWGIKFTNESTSHTIKFTKWNRANYNACFTTIQVMSRYLTLDRGYINNLSTLTQKTSDAGGINYGILANSGNVEMQDMDGELKEYIADGIIEPSNVPVDVYVNNRKIQQHITNDSNYIEQDKILKFDLTNTLSLYEKITYPNRALSAQTTLYTLLNEALTSLGYTAAQITTMLSKTMVYTTSPSATGTIENYLKAITIPYPFLKSAKMNETLNKICTLAQLNMYLDEDNLPVFVSSRPLATTSEISSALHITKTLMKSELEKSIVIKNKFNGIDISAKKIIDSVEKNTFFTTKSQTPNSVYSTSDVAKYRKQTIGTDAYVIRVARIEKYYTSGTFTMPKTLNNGLKSITNPQNAYYSLDYDLTNGETNASIEGALSDDYEYIQTTTPVSDSNNTWQSTSTEKTGTYDGIVVTRGDTSQTLVDDSTIQTTESENYISVNYRILSKIVTYSAGGTYRTSSKSLQVDLSGDAAKYIAKSINITINGNVRTISLEDIDVSTTGIESATTIETIDNSEILQENTKYDTTILTTKIKNDILLDYSNGVSSGNIELYCADVYLANGTKQLDWQQGQLIKPNDVVYFDGDLKPDKTQRYWRVSGRTFNYDGAPTIKLELQEIVGIY